MPRPHLAALVLLTLTLPLGGCAGADGERHFRLLPGVHRFPIQQGNVVTQDMIDKLQPGMTRAQVRFVLGTPLVADTFDQSRWDYLYTLHRTSGQKLREQVTIHFDDDRLVGISGDYLPSGAAVPPGTEPQPQPETEPDDRG